MHHWTFQTQGQMNHPHIVLLHGWLGKASHWKNVWPKEFPCFLIAPELPGHGQMQREEPTQPLSFVSLADTLSTQLNHQFGQRKRVFIGYSMGGRLVLAFASQYPEQIEALVLESCQPGIVEQTERHKRVLLDQERAKKILTEGLSTFLRKWYQAPMFQSLHSKPQRYRNLLKERLQHNPNNVAKVLQELSPGRQPALWDALPTLSVPTLLLCGEYDQKYVTIMQKMNETIPQSQLVILPKAGHNTHFEVPHLWQKEIKEFLQRLTKEC